MKYDPIMCMMVDDSVKTKDAEYKMKVTSYVINKGQSGEYYGLKNKETNQVLYSAPNNWKSREGAKRWAEKKGMIYVEDSNTLDKAIKSCDATSVSSAKSGLKSKIDNWYRNAKIDYGVSGKFIDVREESGALVVYWEEDGKRKKYSFGKYWDDYSVDQLYNIWMEQAD